MSDRQPTVWPKKTVISYFLRRRGRGSSHRWVFIDWDDAIEATLNG